MSSAQQTVRSRNVLWFVVGCLLWAHTMNTLFVQTGQIGQVLSTATFGAVCGVIAVAVSLLAEKADVWSWKQDMITYAFLFACGAVAISFVYQFVMYIIKNWWAIKIVLAL